MPEYGFFLTRIFPQLLEVYRILLVETTLESIMFYYTSSVINTMFVPCTALLYGSTSVTRTLKLSITLLSISCGIHLILFWWCPLACGLAPPHFSNRTLEYLRHNFPFDRLILRQTSSLGYPVPKISTCLTIFWGDTWEQILLKQSTGKRGHHQKRNQTGSTRNAQ